ncbi:MAG: hypothetical protein KAU35_01955 [candidate division Zixibacteria bacterium]|nr:hypothetical protein [candidate division Zixibacteria bacterium]
MHALLFSALLSLPLYPVNPIKQDTVNFMNAHFTAGFTGPNGILSTSAEFTTRYELMVVYPLVVRAAAEYKIGSVIDGHFPEGLLHGPTVAVEALYYRGTNRMMGFIGFGLIWTMYDLKLSSSAADSLRTNFNVTEVRLKSAPGYRIIMGLRFGRVFSLEISTTDVRPDFVYRRALGENSYALQHQDARFHDFRVSFGYLIPLWVR